MPNGESVSASLIHRSELADTGFTALTVSISGENIAIFVQTGPDQLRAWLNSCPHEGRRLDYAPGKFLIDKQNLVCAAHGASFRLSDGFCVGGPCRGESLRAVLVTELADGYLQLDLPA
jgi:nitrite reductase/ring-hydroxylating ferredoxin subunit